ncbi:uracil-DNA glycosylase family protein [Roseiterribacter gracilis]|uniref:Uracil-DNA glycosylase n=1 Tax=Roseiterribacter gracilis TaxID=2812848 RepID=A0A8S8XFW5_9PROT|nr:uracil-DNA glycosylase [Rhodospirillales bacterium TMPK1]
MTETLEALSARARACRLCVDALRPFEPRPTFRAHPAARLLIVGQAPGSRVYETGIPWNDRSGDRLRDWLQLDRDQFYDATRVAVLPAGFCYPGVDKHGGDKPPRPICAPTWHAAFRQHMPDIALTLLIGSYAQRFYLGADAKKSLGATVASWRDHPPSLLPLPHPSWRNTAWLRRNPWFECDVLPALRSRVAALFA